ncbi:MAG: hypothetical protein ACREBP_00410 [Sphingomicrobium sp.]
MIRTFALLAALSAPAAAQVSPITFEAGKLLTIAPGQWSHAATATGSEARFGAYLSLHCDRATRTVKVTRPGIAPGVLTIITDSTTRNLPVGGRLLANDPVLDAMAFSRGRFLVSGGGVTLAIPSWPEAARSIEDCRS